MLIERKQPPLPTRLVARLSWARTARADRVQACGRCRRGWWPGLHWRGRRGRLGCQGLERRGRIERKQEQKRDFLGGTREASARCVGRAGQPPLPTAGGAMAHDEEAIELDRLGGTF